jgi:hypothetical protein
MMIEISDEVLKSIRSIVDYSWEEEADDFQQNCTVSEEEAADGDEPECDPECHIFSNLQLVDQWLTEHGE